MKKIFYLSGTHWDREWYQTYQGFRLRLVRMLDELLDYLERESEFACFYLDGQTIVLEDYLEIRPENRERLVRLVKAGRILIGPWYCMPDEFLVSGESLIRNLNLGHRLAGQFGGVWKMGYVCDIFGHTSQFPQILNRFGIDRAVLGRGTNERTTKMFFRWEAPDGSACTVYKVPDSGGYGSFAMEAAGQRAKGDEAEPGSPEFEAACRTYVDHLFSYASCDSVILTDAMDHESVHPNTPAYLAKIREFYPDCEVVHGGIEEAFRDAERGNLAVRRGELTETAPEPCPYLHLITNTLSSRFDVKRRNDRCETLLAGVLEPLLLWWRGHGVEYPEQYLETAWKHLLQNHPHDSICGCSVDRVHQEMGFRFSQVESLFESISEDAVIVSRGRRKFLSADCKIFNLFEPSPFAVRSAVTVELPFAPNYPTREEPFGYEKIPNFAIFAADGRELEYRIESIRRRSKFRLFSEQSAETTAVTVTFFAERRPFGFTSFRVEPRMRPVRFAGGTADRSGRLENERIKIEIQPDGRIGLTDRLSGRSYPDLLGFLDESELGDGWYSVKAAADRAVVRTELHGVEIRSNNATGATVRLSRTLKVPAEFVFDDTFSRSGRETELPIDCELTLNRGEPYLRVKLTVENKCRDHRLKLVLPTGIDSDTYLANQSFCFVERTCGSDEKTLDWAEPDPLEKNMRGIVLRRDSEGRGLAFLGRYGMFETACPKSGGEMIVTLLRCFSKTHTTNGEHDGQMQGRWEYEFLLVPLNGGESLNGLQNLQDEFKRPLVHFVSDCPAEDFGDLAGSGDVPKKNGDAADSGDAADVAVPGFKIEVTPNCVVTCLKADGDAVLLRLCNTEAEARPVGIAAGFDRVSRCDLFGNPQGIVESAGENGVKLSLAPYEIATLKLERSAVRIKTE